MVRYSLLPRMWTWWLHRDDENHWRRSQVSSLLPGLLTLCRAVASPRAGGIFLHPKRVLLALCPSLRGTSPIYGKIRKNQVLLGGGAWAPPLATGLEVCCCELRSRTQSCLFNCIARHLPKQHVHSIAKKCFSLDAKAKGSSFTFEKIHLPTVGGAHRRNEAKVQNQSAAKASRKVRRNARSDESHFTRLYCWTYTVTTRTLQLHIITKQNISWLHICLNRVVK